jgi:hypothetical protein
LKTHNSHKSFSSSSQNQDTFWGHPGSCERKTGTSFEDVKRTTGKEDDLIPRRRMETKMNDYRLMHYKKQLIALVDTPD